jgi:hypothetical protein
MYYDDNLMVFFESYDSITLYCCFEINFKTAVNSICLGTCLTNLCACFSKRVQKYNFFFISQVLLKVFLRKITFVLLTQSLYELVSFWGGQR